jgi:hypothetical protein
MVLVAATAVAFAVHRYGRPITVGFTTFGGAWEPWLFYWMHRIVPFAAFWSFAVFLIALRDRGRPRRRKMRYAGVVACAAATAAVAVASLISSVFYTVHILEDNFVISKVLSHPTGMHSALPFDNLPMEEIVGAAVLGAWAALLASRRWRTEASWIDVFGRVLGTFWIGLLVTYIYAYAG